MKILPEMYLCSLFVSHSLPSCQQIYEQLLKLSKCFYIVLISQSNQIAENALPRNVVESFENSFENSYIRI